MAAVPEQWRNRHRCTAWILFAVFFCAFILFFVSYVGNSWYVVPVENNRFPPDNPVNPMTLGLFYMCYRGQCMYDLRQDYQIVRLLPPQMAITWAYQNYRTICMAIVTLAAGLCLLTLGLYMFYLAGFRFSFALGYAAGGVQTIAGVIALIGVIIFGVQFRGASATVPFGWSFGLMIVADIILIANGIVTVIITIAIHRHRTTGGQMPVSQSTSRDFGRDMSRSTTKESQLLARSFD